MELDASLPHAVELLLSPMEEPFRRYLDVCDDVHACDESGNTLLHWASAFGNFSAAYALLQRGLEVDAGNGRGATPLLVSAALCPNVAAMGYLLVSHGASLYASAGDNRGLTVQSLLEARQLESVWSWLVLCQSRLYQNGNGDLVKTQGCREIPAVSDDAVSILCSPAELKQLRLRGGAGRFLHVAAVSVPHAPQRRQQQSRPLPTAAAPDLTAASPSGMDTSITATLKPRVELLESQEATNRLLVEKEQLEAFLYVYAEAAAASIIYDDYVDDDDDEERAGWSGPEEQSSEELGVSETAVAASAQKLSGCDGGAAAVRPIQAVLGERIDADGRHHLLVRYTEPNGADGELETWRCAESIAADPVVRAHLEHTYSTITVPDRSDMKTPSTMTLRMPGSPLETWERDQLEAQLRLLPRRVLDNSDESVPLLSQLMRSPTGRSPLLGTSPLIAGFMWNAQQQQEQQVLIGGRGNTNDVVGVAPRLGSFNGSGVEQSESPLLEEPPRPTGRFAPESHRRLGALPEKEAAHDADSAPADQQPLLSDGWRRLRRTPDVPVDNDSEVLPKRTLETVSEKRTPYTSDSSTDTMYLVSPPLSTAPTKAATTFNDSTADSPPGKAAASYLTASQKSEYDRFLYNTALRIIARQQPSKRRSVFKR
ncbi:hypothetical protein ABB37_01164 [Leptomonas pyrrhocoris]|uniref:Uncharacterized protein n=1 Tax=Leptomonas pyrrhocoris TaxID=157538 RepID=A0A0N0DYX1_LEPPY|nr:hypothetical protein ABB37_01164 [Leptomonas pyrrhocoris]XP_015663088.1 hypothetical protein ABB37_01164 [Leptomonas pyrrhocoris]KPA84648.1 hypothetical protein ABB37_01164 [Leptomonas pyrrhocoris]KPA84649.1 hypothetical protein ABB37_01164 [Leptomonas pyrrhocoris]|eukprot:XP_015663087.1 hypothetical protein ABB37_01164 [Leptomonas pyrrhocoris]